MLRKTRDEMQTLIHMYRLDCISIRSAIRIPWWSVAEFLIDDADDLDKQFYKWVDSLPRKNEECIFARKPKHWTERIQEEKTTRIEKTETIKGQSIKEVKKNAI